MTSRLLRGWSFKFPPYHHLWQNGSTTAETWGCLDADGRERRLGFRPDHSRPAVSTGRLEAGKRLAAFVGHRSPHGHQTEIIASPEVTVMPGWWTPRHGADAHAQLSDRHVKNCDRGPSVPGGSGPPFPSKRGRLHWTGDQAARTQCGHRLHQPCRLLTGRIEGG